MGIFDNYGRPGQQEERQDEAEVKKTIVQDGEESRVLGGNTSRTVRKGHQYYEEESENLLMADDGVITTTDKEDRRLPPIIGKDYRDNLVSAGNLHPCKEKGCDRMVSNMSGAEYKPGLWRCSPHYKKYDLRQFLKWLLSLFYQFKDEDELPQLPIVREEQRNEREQK